MAFRLPFIRKPREDAAEEVKMERLRAAESAGTDLQRRADELTKILQERRQRNHWRESIEKMIQGA